MEYVDTEVYASGSQGPAGLQGEKGGQGPAGLQGEFGDWTPSLVPIAASFTSINYAAREGKYIKTGNFVRVQFKIAVSSFVCGSGNIAIRGLPFPPISSSNISNCTLIETTGLTISSSMLFYNGTDWFICYNGYYLNRITPANIAQTFTIIGEMSYFTK